MQKRYFLLLLVICFLVVNSSYAYDDKTQDTNITQESITVTENDTNLNIENTTDTVNIINTSTLSISNTVSKTKTTINTINENDFYKTKYIQVELTDTTGKKIPNVDIYMTLSTSTTSKTYKLVTDKNGLVKAAVTLTENYNALFEFKGTTTYAASSKKITVIKEITLAKIKDASAKLKEKIEKTGRIPTKIKIDNTNYTIEEFIYLMSKAVLNIKNKNINPIKIKEITKAPDPNTKEVTGEIYETEIIKITKNLLDFMDSNSRTPNYLSCSLGKLSYSQIIYMYAKILEFDKRENRLPNYVTIISIKKIKEAVDASKLTTTNTLTSSELSKFLVATTNCQCTNTNIINLAKTLTSSLTSVYQKAKAIFNYVRDIISYEKYNNTKRGAVKTLNDKKGNCVDQSHLLIAIARAAKIPARYVHGRNCKFTSGLVCGHVWVELLIDGKWYAADPTSPRNSLGVINNWNTNSYTLKGKYATLTF